jgi:hypothetical protein
MFYRSNSGSAVHRYGYMRRRFRKMAKELSFREPKPKDGEEAPREKQVENRYSVLYCVDHRLQNNKEGYIQE